MNLFDLSGKWNVTIDDGINYETILPGTLDENKIGHQDSCSSNAKDEVITTRFTRKYSYEGTAVFSRVLSIGKHNTEERFFLEAERSRKLMLRINGEVIKPYTPGTMSTPYVFEITDYITDENTIELICDNSYKDWPHDAILYSSAATDETQTNWNGILGYLRLRNEKNVFISQVRVYPQSGYLTVKIDIDAKVPYQGVLRIVSSVLELNIEQLVSVETGIHTITLSSLLLKSNCRKWDEFEGNMHDICISCDNLESKTVSFGIRDFCDNGSGRLALNGRVIFIRSETNCCVFPETGYMPLTIDKWMDVLNIYKSYGINCLRFHSHCPPDAAFTAADILGMLMQPELSHWNPNNAFEDDESFNYYQLELKKILLTYANHPSFVMLTFGNELHSSDKGHARMSELLLIAKEIDSTRMYANGSNVHYGNLGTDADSDFYTSSDFYDKMLRGTSSPMKGYINECYPNTKTSFDEEMRMLREKYLKPVFTFEVGQYEILPDFDEIDDFKGVTLPENLSFIKEKVIEKGFIIDWKKRVEATGELAKIAYREEIEAVLRTRELSGISLLSLQDFPGQGTALVGMMNSHLEPKPYDFARPEKFKAFFSDVLPLVLLDKYTYVNNEILSADIDVANYGKYLISTPVIYKLTHNDNVLYSGVLPAVNIPCGTVTRVGSLNISLRELMTAEALTTETFTDETFTAKKIMLTVSISEYKNEYPIWVYPDKKIDAFSSVIITNTFLETKKALEEGKCVLYSPEADDLHFPDSIQSQFTTDFWSVGTFPAQTGCMGCLIDSSHQVFLEFPTEFYSNWQWWAMSKGRAMIMPDNVEPIITVIDCYARLRKLGFLFECKVGNGKLMVSSMGLMEKQRYPEVRSLLYNILRHMDSQEFIPEQEISLEVLKGMIS